jgi:hypothetical protein
MLYQWEVGGAEVDQSGKRVVLNGKGAIEAVKKLAISNSIPVFGTGKSAPLESANLGYRPSDTLPSAKSVLCVGVPVPRGVFNRLI